MHITTGFYSADLFSGWEEDDIKIYDEAASAEKYADLCEAAIREDYPEATIEVPYQSGATGELSYNLQTRVDNVSAAGANDNRMADIAAVDDIVSKVYADYEWCVKRDWITLPQASRRHDIPLPTLRYHAKRGGFEAYKPDKRTWLAEAGSVEEWAKERRK